MIHISALVTKASRKRNAISADMPDVYLGIGATVNYVEAVSWAQEYAMANQKDLTEILHTLKQVVCVKG